MSAKNPTENPTHPTPISRLTAKAAARELMAAAKGAGRRLTYTQALAEVASANGYANVHHMTASYVRSGYSFRTPMNFAVAEAFADALHPTPEELRAFHPEGTSPLYPVEDWQYETANGDTRLGYWEWLAGRHEADASFPTNSQPGTEGHILEVIGTAYSMFRTAHSDRLGEKIEAAVLHALDVAGKKGENATALIADISRKSGFSKLSDFLANYARARTAGHSGAPEQRTDTSTLKTNAGEGSAPAVAGSGQDAAHATVARALREKDVVYHETRLNLVNGRNTAISYLYRDADNYKSTTRVVLEGRLSPSAIERLLAMLDDDQFMIPGQIGLQDLQDSFIGCESYWDPEKDHPWHELNEIAYVDAKPTAKMTAAELEAHIRQLDAWNPGYEPDFAPKMHERYEKHLLAMGNDEEDVREILDHARKVFPDLKKNETE